MSPEAQHRHRAYLEHLTTMRDSSAGRAMLSKPTQVAARIAAIVDAGKPRFKYNLAVDAKLVDGVITRLVPFSARAALNRRMYRLTTSPTQHRPVTTGLAVPTTAASQSALDPSE